MHSILVSNVLVAHLVKNYNVILKDNFDQFLSLSLPFYSALL